MGGFPEPSLPRPTERVPGSFFVGNTGCFLSNKSPLQPSDPTTNLAGVRSNGEGGGAERSEVDVGAWGAAGVSSKTAPAACSHPDKAVLVRIFILVLGGLTFCLCFFGILHILVSRAVFSIVFGCSMLGSSFCVPSP